MATFCFGVFKFNLSMLYKIKGYSGTVPTTEYTELQPLLSGVHSVMRVKSVLLVREGGARPPPLIPFTITSKVAVYAPAEWADTLTLFHLYQYMYSVLHTLSESD
jgi:hypothetical protein